MYIPVLRDRISSRQLFLSEFRSSRAFSDLPFHGVYSNHYIVENTFMSCMDRVIFG